MGMGDTCVSATRKPRPSGLKRGPYKKDAYPGMLLIQFNHQRNLQALILQLLVILWKASLGHIIPCRLLPRVQTRLHALPRHRPWLSLL